jgi:hypothetical protein
VRTSFFYSVFQSFSPDWASCQGSPEQGWNASSCTCHEGWNGSRTYCIRAWWMEVVPVTCCFASFTLTPWAWRSCLAVCEMADACGGSTHARPLSSTFWQIFGDVWNGQALSPVALVHVILSSLDHFAHPLRTVRDRVRKLTIRFFCMKIEPALVKFLYVFYELCFKWGQNSNSRPSMGMLLRCPWFHLHIHYRSFRVVCIGPHMW